MKRLTIREISLVAIFPALMAATSGISIPIGNLPAITLQTMFVFLAGLLLGPKLGSISMAIYVLMGVIGLPVFANFRGGLDVIMGGSGGFVIGFILSALFVGFMKSVNFINNKLLYIFIILVLGNLVIYIFGAAYISYLLNTSFFSTIATFIPYLPGDFIKIIVVIYVYTRMRSYITYEAV